MRAPPSSAYAPAMASDSDDSSASGARRTLNSAENCVFVAPPWHRSATMAAPTLTLAPAVEPARREGDRRRGALWSRVVSATRDALPLGILAVAVIGVPV